MISEDEYKAAIVQREKAEEVIGQYHREKRQAFKDRLRNNPTFTDDELVYSATALCPCGYGMAYPKDCGLDHYWDCSAILRGIADPNVEHAAQMPFMFSGIKSESKRNGTTRDVFKPMDK